MMDYELIDHTADIGIRVRGKDLKTLFKKAADAMFDVIARPQKARSNLRQKKFTLNLSAVNCDELFVRWLSELLSLSDSKDVYFKDIKIKSVSATAIKADVAGFPRRLYQGIREVKAVTYHELKIKKIKTGFCAEVIFDV